MIRSATLLLESKAVMYQWHLIRGKEFMHNMVEERSENESRSNTVVDEWMYLMEKMSRDRLHHRSSTFGQLRPLPRSLVTTRCHGNVRPSQPLPPSNLMLKRRIAERGRKKIQSYTRHILLLCYSTNENGNLYSRTNLFSIDGIIPYPEDKNSLIRDRRKREKYRSRVGK